MRVGIQEQRREAAIRGYQAAHGFDVQQLRETKAAQDAERARVIKKLVEIGIDIHGLSEQQMKAYAEVLR